MYFGATFDFRCDRKVLDIQSAWNAAGPYHWNAFDNEQYGVYIVTRQPDIHLKIRVLGEQPDYSLEIDSEVPPETADTTKGRLLSTIFEQLLPAIGATGIRDTSRETLKEFGTTAMPVASPFKSQLTDVGLASLSIQPKIRMRAVLFFAVVFAILGFISYVKPQPYRAAYGSLDAAAVMFLIVQYRKERALVRNRLSAIGVVTDYQVRGRGVPHFGKGVPVIKYEFVAFDQLTYQGETGWGTQNLRKGSRLPILYDPENPARNHPLRGFVFHSFT